MFRYPKEYEEAISRLNAPERSPLPYAPLPYGPVPNKCNYMNWNRIMAETRQGVLPKCSILQRIDLGSQNDLVMVSDAKEYTYTLDPSFTFDKGARKSIAVRAVDIYNVIPNGTTKIAREYFSGVIELQYRSYTGGKTTNNIVDINLSNVSFECSNDIAVSLQNFANAFAQMIYTNCEAAVYGTGLLNPDISTEYQPSTQRIRIMLTSNPEKVYTLHTATSFSAKWYIRDSNVYDMYNTKPGHLAIKIDAEVDSTYRADISFDLPSEILDYRSASICGSINPWTKNNIIAPTQYTSDTLTKVFPWNGNTEVKFWFINENGEKVRWRVVRGYIDLELIIDNSDSYAMTGDN